jgi:hypothetical protein
VSWLFALTLRRSPLLLLLLLLVRTRRRHWAQNIRMQRDKACWPSSNPHLDFALALSHGT